MTNSEIKELLPEFEASLQSETALLEIVRILRERGLDQVDVYLIFDDYLDHLRESGRGDEPEADNISDVLERIYGWCREDRKLFGRTMSNEEILERRLQRSEK